MRRSVVMKWTWGGISILGVSLLLSPGACEEPMGRVRFVVSDEGGAPLPAKVTFLGREGTPSPDFGSSTSAAGSGNIVYSTRGSGAVALAPGRYRAVFSRGIEYGIVERDFEITGEEEVLLEGTLTRVVDTRGYLSGDFHIHAAPSFDSKTPLEDRIVTLVGEGVEIAVATDHNQVTDYTPEVERLGVTAWLHPVVGNEITTASWGHFNAFPLDPTGERVNPVGLPSDLFADIHAAPGDELIQVNHPREPKMGYFNHGLLDPETMVAAHPAFDPNFDAIEVLNSKELYGLEAGPKARSSVFHDWMAFLDRGIVYTATGNSDSHQVEADEVGYPRNFVFVGSDDPAQLTDARLISAIRAHRVVVSSGPMIHFSAGGGHVGDLVPQPAEGGVTLTIRVEAPPWIAVDRVRLLGNGEALADFDLEATEGVVRLSVAETFSFERDTWLIVIAEGDRPLLPVLSASDPPPLPFAFTNPIWIDADRNGRFDPPIPNEAER